MSSGTGSNYPAQVIAGENAGINQAFQPFPYPNATQAANNAYSGIANDVPSGSISGLSNAGSSLLGQAPRAFAAGQTQYNNLAPYVTQALQTGFDPQHALYNQLFGQQQQQNLASQAMAGVGQSPYAAGLTAQGNNNFNIDWQNAQLGRQQTAAGTAEGLSSTAMAGLGQGLSDEIGAIGGAGNAFAQAAGLNAQQVAQYLAYLQGNTSNAAAGVGAQLGSLNAGTGLYQATNQGNYGQQQLLNSSLGGLGSLLGTGIGNNLGGLSGLLGGGGSGVSGLFDSLPADAFAL